MLEALSRRSQEAWSSAPAFHMSDIPAFPYRLLWEIVRSVATLTRQDARDGGTEVFRHVRENPWSLPEGRQRSYALYRSPCVCWLRPV